MEGNTGPVPQGEVRIGDAERQAAAAQLQEHFAAGRLTWEELDERLGAAYAARTHSELHRLFGDLPALGAPVAAGKPDLMSRARAQLPAPLRGFEPWMLAVLAVVVLAAVMATEGAALFPVGVLLFVFVRRSHGPHRSGPYRSGHRRSGGYPGPYNHGPSSHTG